MYGKNIKDFGAVSDGKSIVTNEINEAIKAADLEGGGTVIIPSGTFLTGAIKMKSNINLYLDSGAILKFSNDINDFPRIHTRWEGAEQENYASCIYGTNLKNVSITGHGMIDGNGKFWWDLLKVAKKQVPRPKLISFENTNNILIEGVTLVDSPSWTINPIRCENINVNGITLINPKDSPNTDGINPESCRNVHISNCHINVGDDCITIKSGTEAATELIPCENIVISNCTMLHGHGGIVIGSEMSGGVRNVTISNCIFEGTDRGIRLKTRRGRGGLVEDIRVNNIIMKDVFCPFVINMYYYCGPAGKDEYVWSKKPYPITNETPRFKSIHFSNITARGVSAAAGFIYGLAESFVEDVTFDSIIVELKKDAIPELPAMMAQIEPMNERGFFCGNVKYLKFDNVIVENIKGPAIHIKNSENVSYNNVEVRNSNTINEIIHRE